MRKSYKPNRRLGYSTEVSYSYNKNEVEVLKDFYNSMVANKNKPLSELVESISKSNYIKATKEWIEEKINVITKTHSVREGEELRVILKLAVALEENNLDKIYKNRLELVRIEKDKEMISKLKRKGLMSAPKKQAKPKDQLISELKEDLDVILEEKKNPEELYKEGKIKTSQFSKKFSDNIDAFDTDTYIDYLCSIKEDKPIEEKDLLDMIDVLKHFSSNLAMNLNAILALNPVTDEEIIRSFKIDGEDELKSMFTASIDRLYDWKVKKISERLQVYVTLLTNANNMLKGYYGSVKTLSTRNKKVLSEQSPYFMDDYENMINISKTYKSKILESNYQDESKKEELDTKYKKRMVLR